MRLGVLVALAACGHGQMPKMTGDDDTALEIVTKLSHHGAEQTETLRAFTRDEAEDVIKKL